MPPEGGDGHAFQAAQEVPAHKKQDPPFGPGVAVPEGSLPEQACGVRDHTVDVEKGELPGQQQDGEPVLQEEEGDVLRTRKRVPQLRGTQEVYRRIRGLVQQRKNSPAARRCSCFQQEH